MKIACSNIALVLIMFLYVPNTILGQQDSVMSPYGKVTLERTEVRHLQSDIIPQEYEIYIGLPASYKTTDTLYPVIYILDPYRAFSMTKGFIDLINYPHATIPEVILVGIGYGGLEEQGMLNFVVGRTRDYTPVKDQAVEEYWENLINSYGNSSVDFQTGGAKLFLDFISRELIPFVESEYRIDPGDRMLSGYSYGGLFVLYTLFHEPGLFGRYFAGSPGLHYSDDVTFTYEAEYANKRKDIEARLFMSAGALEERTSRNVLRMSDSLESRNYPGLHLETVILPDETHVSCPPAAITRALIRLYDEGN